MLIKNSQNKAGAKKAKSHRLSDHLTLFQRSKSALNLKLEKIRKKKNYGSEIIGGNYATEKTEQRNERILSTFIDTYNQRKVKTESNMENDELKVLKQELTGIDQWLQDKIHGKLSLF